MGLPATPQRLFVRPMTAISLKIRCRMSRSSSRARIPACRKTLQQPRRPVRIISAGCFSWDAFLSCTGVDL